MSNTYTFTVEKMDCYPTYDTQSNVVFTVYFRMDATDGTYYAISNGQASFDYEQGQPFTPFEQLTESQVEGWIDSKVGLAKLKEQLDEIISQKSLEAFVTLSPPWA